MVDQMHWWTKQLRVYNSKKMRHPPLVMSRMNTLTGRFISDSPSIHDELNYRYARYSQNYWEGVKERQMEYLRKKIIS